MADARKHLPEPRPDLTSADLLRAPLDPFRRSVHLALVGGTGRTPGQGHDRDQCQKDPEPVTFPRHDAPPAIVLSTSIPASTMPTLRVCPCGVRCQHARPVQPFCRVSGKPYPPPEGHHEA